MFASSYISKTIVHKHQLVYCRELGPSQCVCAVVYNVEHNNLNQLIYKKYMGQH